MLYLVGTPIGNMQDLSPRAIEVLSHVDLVACEDTRRTGLLLAHFGISAKLVSYHEHNKASSGSKLIARLKEGAQIALVSDAGMPSISDPGEDLVKLCIEEGIEVTAVPGPVAGITALVLSGMDTRHYYFEGFLPVETKERKERLSVVAETSVTTILYEAPHRLLKTLSDLSAAGMGERRISACRELTKKYEEVIRGTVEEVTAHFEEVPPKGEFVLVLEGAPKNDAKRKLSPEERRNVILDLESKGLSTKDIAKTLALEWGESKKALYDEVLEMIK
ncbi:MAG TPA: 16S rRNA (cytidine(1402)-2'-O)-methyltransferase [Clostridiales bacterium]|jgi:16S rRNA (cytidine1402-2'-O)-methyltransferase|nr:16S rRNA (cytidine(1402)-2'-O)-methyltransferase [Clostridiales bacterium]HBZ78245.1 16S rRNA (cytidine(1402)-2'-O)-methyltransferase [Clostridiales bacterium]